MISTKSCKTSDTLINLDLVQKFLLKSIFQIPRIKEIVLDYPLSRSFAASETSGSITEQELKINFFLLFYFYFQKVPYLKIKKYIVKTTNKLCLVIYMRVYFSNFKTINFFLQKLFLEKKELKNNLNKNILNTFFFSLKKEKFCKIQFFLPTHYFEDFDILSNNILLKPNVKNLEFQAGISILKPNKLTLTKNFFKNLPFFWING